MMDWRTFRSAADFWSTLANTFLVAIVLTIGTSPLWLPFAMWLSFR